MARRPALGKGLGALLGELDEVYENELGTQEYKKKVPIASIKTNPNQPRKVFCDESIKELASSIKEYGLIQPIVLLRKDQGYVLVAGERRLRACMSLGMEDIKAIIADEFDENLAEVALIENIQREDLNPYDLALAYEDLQKKCNLTQEELALKMHKSRSEVANILRILKLSKKSKELLASGKLSKGHAKVLAGLEKEAEEELVDEILTKKLSVRDAERRVNRFKLKTAKPKALNALVDKLHEMGYKVKLQKHKVILEFKDDNQVGTFCDLL